MAARLSLNTKRISEYFNGYRLNLQHCLYLKKKTIKIINEIAFSKETFPNNSTEFIKRNLNGANIKIVFLKSQIRPTNIIKKANSIIR